MVRFISMTSFASDFRAKTDHSPLTIINGALNFLDKGARHSSPLLSTANDTQKQEKTQNTQAPTVYVYYLRTMNPKRPSNVRIWATAARPHTLTASLCPCLVSFAATRPPLHLQALAFLFCVTVQMGTNLHNDYSDYVQGADTDKRVGQPRATAQGWLTPTQTCTAACGCLSVTFLTGLYGMWLTNLWNDPLVWFVLLTSVFNAFAYTAGPFPLGYIGLEKWSIAYQGLGDIFVFVYFGLVATLMLPYAVSQSVQSVEIDWRSQWIYGAQVGLLATNIIVVNNLRDRHTDVLANKRTTAVRFGRTFALIEYVMCQVITYELVLVNAYDEKGFRAAMLLPLLSIPLAFREAQAVFRKEGGDLNPHVGGAAKVQLAFCVLLSAGLFLSS
jgi:1,4-dihydroxy-2-naphthoate octaprenyltransferase